jgi:F-type H+-transporting ATPase subunit epsilon
MSLTLEIVTPEKKIYSQEVTNVTIPASEGEICVLEGHVPLLTIVNAGEIIANSDKGTEFLAVDKGFVQVFGDKIAVLTEQAITLEDMDINTIEEAHQRAEEALKEAIEKNINPASIEKLESIARFSIAQKLIKSRRG